MRLSYSIAFSHGFEKRLSTQNPAPPWQRGLVRVSKSSLAGGEKKKTIQQKFGMLPASFTCHVIVNLCSADGIAAPHHDYTLLMSPGGPS